MAEHQRMADRHWQHRMILGVFFQLGKLMTPNVVCARSDMSPLARCILGKVKEAGLSGFSGPRGDTVH
jgi:hypothetical protein